MLMCTTRPTPARLAASKNLRVGECLRKSEVRRPVEAYPIGIDQDIDAARQFSPGLDQLVRARTSGRENAAGHGEHITIVIGCQLRRQQRPAFRGRLGYQDAERKTGNDAVATREAVLLRPGTEREFAHQSAVVDDLLREPLMRRRVNDIDSACHNGDGAAARPQRGFMRRLIHAAS